MAFCFRLSHALFELQTRKKLEKLTENAAESIHGRILLVGVFAFTNLMRWIRPSFQIPNLDKSECTFIVGYEPNNDLCGLCMLDCIVDGFLCNVEELERCEIILYDNRFIGLEPAINLCPKFASSVY